ncbi:hypothetical protein D9757_001421 [Collybiopsis confluens]|uniref:Uncharacterized protein n=1 Tax=Collybiopsis confluens TaxID=2823264 RepID=A0A8H5HZF1_9AGAR|nr:hypothetical protein D9757_001421 [Collybiopsis confluens]
MSCTLYASPSLPKSHRAVAGKYFSLEASKLPLHVRALSTSTNSSTSIESSMTSSDVDSFSSASSAPYDPRRRISALTNEMPSSNWKTPTHSMSKPKSSAKTSTEHILVRARNANIPALERYHLKKNVAIASRRQAQRDSDSDYEEYRSSICQQPKKQKRKSIEQIKAEERRMLNRKAKLENDPLLDPTKMCPSQVWCIPCKKNILIDSRRQYYATLWFKHRGKRHPGVPSKRSSVPKSDVDLDMDVEMEPEPCKKAIKSPVALAVPLIDDAFATNILADMYSKAQGLRLLSLAAEALG